MSLKSRALDAVHRARRRFALLDHGIRTQQHYGAVKGGMQAGGVTYFAFLSFFPILALAFFVVGYVAHVYPQAQDNLVSAIQGVLPGIVGNGKGEISIDAVQANAGTAGIIGLLGVVYSGLGWLSAMRNALVVVFEEPQARQPNFFVGKARDLLTLLLVGLVLVVSVAISGLVTGFSTQILDAANLGGGATPVLAVLTVLLGLGADMVLFYALFRLLVAPPERARSLWSGAFVGALGFEALKWLSSLLLGSTQSQPAFQAFGIALILLVWINYFSRVVLYAAAWAQTDRADLSVVDAPERRPVTSSRTGPADPSLVDAVGRQRAPDLRPGTAFAAGAGTMLALVALLRKRRER